MITPRHILLIAGISGAFAVGLGAFGAHGLEAFLEANGRTETFETAVKYHFYHSLLMLGIGILWLTHRSMPYLRIAALSCGLGILIFSGSLYILCFTGIGWLGAITPIGGLLLIISWVLTGAGAWKLKTDNQ
ncbi:MAG: DUF423 domain-containing protein [Cyclobacteriaceae bacterium]